MSNAGLENHVGVITVLLSLACGTWSLRTQHAPRPHIIMIVADDLGWDDVSFHGSPQIPTPHIDHLANNGVILNSYYVSPICTPSRASFMTGKHPISLGVQHGTIFGTQPYGLPLDEVTTPQYLKSLGYHTHGVGKWHLGFFEKEYTPTYRGFDSFYGFWNGKEDYWDHSSDEDVWGFDLRDNMKAVKNESNHYGTELFSLKAEQIIYSHDKSQPLYLYVAQQGVHSANGRQPLQAPKRLIKDFPHMSSPNRRIYSAMVASLDESVGNITRALRKTGMLQNSVIVFTTDNGGAPRGFNWNQGCNYPFRGGKDTFWEGGVRGVGLVYSDLIQKRSRVSYDLIDATDWMPTFYHLAGGDVSKIQGRIDGMNVWDTIAFGKPSPRTEVLHNIDPIREFAAIRVENYKLVVNQDAVFRTTWHPRYEVIGELNEVPKPKTIPGAVINCGRWDLKRTAECDTDKFPCLFDISRDPCEYDNIAKSHLPIVRKLLQRLLLYQKKSRPVWFPQRDPSANPSNFDGYWTFWRKSTANELIMKKAASSIPKYNIQSDCRYSNWTNSATTGLGGVNSSTTRHLNGDESIYNMLNTFLNETASSTKHKVPLRHRRKIRKALSKLFWVMALKAGAKVESHRRLIKELKHRLNGVPRKHEGIPRKMRKPMGTTVNSDKAASRMALFTILKAAGDLTGANIAKKYRIQRKGKEELETGVPRASSSWKDSRRKASPRFREGKRRHQNTDSFSSQPSKSHTKFSEEQIDYSKDDDEDDDDGDYSDVIDDSDEASDSFTDPQDKIFTVLKNM